jgi:transcriptional regulator with XRE-family HTH domain
VAGDAYGSTVAKRRLASRLAVMRQRTGMSLNEVSDKLGWSRGRLDRYERDEWRLPDASHVRDLARIYGVGEDERSELEELGRLAKERVWWRSYEDVFGKGNEFPGFENDAAKISVYMPLVLPGLLQTQAYMKSLFAVGPWPAEWQERGAEARLRRQEILDRTDGTVPRLVAVITEASLRYSWGSAEDRAAQVERLVEVGVRRNVELLLLRFDGGPHPGMSSLINIFDFADDGEEPVVYLENDTEIAEVTRPGEVRAYQETFARIRDAALSPSATRAFLTKLGESQE